MSQNFSILFTYYLKNCLFIIIHIPSRVGGWLLGRLGGGLAKWWFGISALSDLSAALLIFIPLKPLLVWAATGVCRRRKNSWNQNSVLRKHKYIRLLYKFKIIMILDTLLAHSYNYILLLKVYVNIFETIKFN